MVGTGSITTPFGLPLETEGIFRMEIAIIQNQYKNSSPNATTLSNIDYVPTIVGSFPNSTAPNGISSYPENLDLYGIGAKTVDAGYRIKSTIKNLYFDADKQVDVADWITLQPLDITQQVKGYLDEYGSLNLGGSGGIQALNVIGSILNGQGLGLAKGGVVTNFDIRSSLAGRVLAGSGAINDTKLGMIGGQQLALALANNAAFNLEQQALGALNVQDNVLSLVKNGTLAGFRPNYQITVPSGTIGKIADYTSRILGFTLPKSYLDASGSIFQTDNVSENIDRANAMILNTGKGQFVALIKNATANINGISPNGYDNPQFTAFRTGYAPGYKDTKGTQQISGNQLYAFSKNGNFINLLISSDGVIPDFSFARESKVEDSGFVDFSSEYLDGYTESNIKKPTFSWATTEGGMTNSLTNYTPYAGVKKSLLQKTQLLFNSKGMLNIVSAKGNMNINTPSQIQTAVVGGGISKGNAVLQAQAFNDDGLVVNSFKTPDDTYCRSWTTFDRYDKVSKLVRSRGIDTIVPYRFQTEGSILDAYGNPQIAPYGDKEDPKKYMFSIENLAWADRIAELAPCEVGSGDLITGKQGRIMWFPPYDIQFNENSSISWESNNFIGRGEPLYTYNNTERSGSLSFKIIVDHPSYINAFSSSKNKGGAPDDHYIASFWAGCVEPSKNFADKLTVTQINDLAGYNVTIPQQKSDTAQEPPLKTPIQVFFPNDVYDYQGNYENGLCGTTPIDYNANSQGEGCGTNYQGQITNTNRNYADRYNYGLNAGVGQGKTYLIDGVTYKGYDDPSLMSALNTWLTNKCPNCVVTIKGYASNQGNSTANTQLALNRANDIKATLMNNLHTSVTDQSIKNKLFIANGEGVDTSSPCPTAKDANGKIISPTDSIGCKVARRVEITFAYDPTVIPKKENAPSNTAKSDDNKAQPQVIGTIINKFYDECDYFTQLTDVDPFVFDTFRDKIKYFHPAFHSTTPEGLNSRLTFLLQCTRQGPTLEAQGANNLAFGRPPVCILRIGDFYNTKIIIDSVGIDYEPLVWDLNPEGIGVQPMIASVNLSFKFIGGSTLLGPINKLQNALSFNYFANTQVYDPRADYISKNRPFVKTTDSTGNITSAVGDFGKLIPVDASSIGYYINNDFTGRMTPEYIPNPDQVANATPGTIQTQDNEDTLNGTQQAKPPSVTDPTDDKQVLSNIGFVNYSQLNGDAVTLGFTFNGSKVDLALNDGKSYAGQVYIVNSSKPSQKNNIGTVTISSNGVGAGVTFKGTSSSVTLPASTRGQWQATLALDANQSATYSAGLITSPLSSIVVEFALGGKRNLMFSTNTAV
jgi:hypothetical protein